MTIVCRWSAVVSMHMQMAKGSFTSGKDIVFSIADHEATSAHRWSHVTGPCMTFGDMSADDLPGCQ